MNTKENNYYFLTSFNGWRNFENQESEFNKKGIKTEEILEMQ